MDTENVEIIKAMVKTGMGVGIVPYQAVAREVHAGQLFCARIEGHELVRETGEKMPNSLVVGEVVNVHIDDAVIVDGMIDMTRIRPLARLGYMDYSVVDNIFTMLRVPPPAPVA